MANEFEIIPHNQMHDFRLFLVNLLYRTPHVHKDFEICLILDGQIDLLTSGQTYHVPEHSFFVVNPFQPHELKSDSPALILSVQVSPSFFSDTFPQIQSIQLSTQIHSAKGSDACRHLFSMLLKLARSYLQKQEAYELLCAGIINTIFYEFLRLNEYHIIPEAERGTYELQQQRIRRISDYINQHYPQKLLLSDIAKELELSLYYLSHFFKANFGISFQDYLARIRSEKARQLLLLTRQSLLDISISAGFSDPKYFNASFKKQYGCTPTEYRRQFKHAQLPDQQISMLTTQEFLSEEAGLILLDQFMIRE